LRNQTQDKTRVVDGQRIDYDRHVRSLFDTLVGGRFSAAKPQSAPRSWCNMLHGMRDRRLQSRPDRSCEAHPERLWV
jgi:hypothetical protein